MKKHFHHLSQSLLILLFISACQSADNDLEKGSEKESPTTEEVIIEEFEEGKFGEFQKQISELKKVDGYKTLDEIAAIDLISYLSGTYGASHSHYCITFDPRDDSFLVSAGEFQERYPSNEMDQALSMFRTALRDKGDLPEGEMKEKERETVIVDGEEMVVMDMNELFPDDTEAKEHFTSAQYSFLKSEVSASEGYAYLAGIGSRRDHPLMYTFGYKESAKIKMITNDQAYEFPFEEVDSAFSCYKSYINERLK